jgi:uncharacterized protein DUF4013
MERQPVDWYWNGTSWQPVVVRWDRPGMFWFFSARGWVGNFLLAGAVGLIPVVGQMVQLGWYLEARDNLRRGHWLVPHVTFDYLGRGAWVFLAQLVFAVYALALWAPLVAAIVAAALLGAPAWVIVLLAAALALEWLLTTLLSGYLHPALIGVVDRHGFGAAVNPVNLWRTAGANASATWRTFGSFFLGYVVVYFLGFVVPFGHALLLPVAYLMAAPGQAELDERVPLGG